ncbi:hypothetical protein, partial [Candidatus Accumulibacter sp. ACC012]|uniref:hypothetical protein n=1 Tax=Candidatus Accumulibacter sp. ACC012 TaxID=2823332 RepID=UPI0025B928BD
MPFIELPERIPANHPLRFRAEQVCRFPTQRACRTHSPTHFRRPRLSTPRNGGYKEPTRKPFAKSWARLIITIVFPRVSRRRLREDRAMCASAARHARTCTSSRLPLAEARDYFR